MTAIAIPIGQVKRDISELVNRVAYRQEQIVLTSRGKPKAVLISVEDYERNFAQDNQQVMQRQKKWEAWLNDVTQLSQQIAARRQGELIDIDVILDSNKQDLEARLDFLFR